jgi:hypothetical protein
MVRANTKKRRVIVESSDSEIEEISSKSSNPQLSIGPEPVKANQFNLNEISERVVGLRNHPSTRVTKRKRYKQKVLISGLQWLNI